MKVKQRNTGLDLLRCIAVWLVLIRHLPNPANAILKTIQVGGWIGVDIFFVLNGFLVAGLLFEEHKKTGNTRIGRFLIRRGLKIYPAFWAMILVTVLVEHSNVATIVNELLFIQNYRSGLWTHTWSLAVEEHYYLFLALLWYVTTKLKSLNNPNHRLIPVVFLLLAGACMFYRRTATVATMEGAWIVLFMTHTRIDGLMAGTALAWWWHYKRTEGHTEQLKKHGHWLILVGITLLLPAFIGNVAKDGWLAVCGVTLFYIGASLILIALYVNPPPGKLVKLLAMLGTFSYSTYLWHLPLQAWIVTPLCKGNQLLYTFTYLTGAWAVGIVMAKLIEFPVLKLRDAVTEKEVLRPRILPYWPSATTCPK